MTTENFGGAPHAKPGKRVSALQSTKIMATYCALVANLELEADSIKNKLATLDPRGHSPGDYNPDRHYFEGKATAIDYAIRLVNHNFRHIHVRHETDNRKCAACGQDLAHEVHQRIKVEVKVNESTRYEP